MEEQLLIQKIMSAVLNAYNDKGELVEEYYNNIILPDLTKEEYNLMQDMAAFLG